MFFKLIRTFASIKKLNTSATSAAKGLIVTFPNLNNQTQHIENAL